MNRLFFILIVVLVTPCFALQQALFEEESVTPSAVDMGSTTFFLGGDGTYSHPTYTIGSSDYSDGDTTGTLSTGADVNSSAARYGTNGLDFDGSFDYITFDSASIITDSGSSFSTWFSVVDTPSENTTFLDAREDNSNRMQFEMASSDEVRLIWMEGGSVLSTALTTSANLATGTWYFAEFYFTFSAGTVSLSLSIYSSTGSLIQTVTDSDSATGITFADFRIGNYTSADVTFYMDNFIVSSAYDDDHTAWMNLVGYP